MTAPPSPARPARGPWPQLRAVLVLLHVIAVVLGALPAPSGGMSRAAWRDPTVQDEFDAWRGKLAALGWSMSPEAFEEGLWTLGSELMAVRSRALRPFKHYYRYAGTTQSWRMFVAPHRYPARLFIDAREDGVWFNIFEEGAPGPDWRQSQLEQDRFRSALFRYSWPNYSRSYGQFSRWVAKEVAIDYPEADAVRLRWFKYKTLSPEDAGRGLEPEGEFIYIKTLPTVRGEPRASQAAPAPAAAPTPQVQP